MPPSSQPHAGFFESNDAIPSQYLAHAQTFDRGVHGQSVPRGSFNSVCPVIDHEVTMYIVIYNRLSVNKLIPVTMVDL